MIDITKLSQYDGESAKKEIADLMDEIISIKDIVMPFEEKEDLLEDLANDILGYGPRSSSASYCTR